jgi:hypothetical protein
VAAKTETRNEATAAVAALRRLLNVEDEAIEAARHLQHALSVQLGVRERELADVR